MEIGNISANALRVLIKSRGIHIKLKFLNLFRYLLIFE